MILSLVARDQVLLY